MLRKYPRPRRAFRIFIAGLVIIEAGFLGAAYYVYHKLNTSRDYRYYMYVKNYETLNMFYKFVEFTGDKTTRQLDYQSWGIEDKRK